MVPQIVRGSCQPSERSLTLAQAPGDIKRRHTPDPRSGIGVTHPSRFASSVGVRNSVERGESIASTKVAEVHSAHFPFPVDSGNLGGAFSPNSVVSIRVARRRGSTTALRQDRSVTKRARQLIGTP